MNDTDRKLNPEPASPQRDVPDTGPRSPKVDRPAPTNPLLDRLKRVDPDQAKKYRQRSGQ